MTQGRYINWPHALFLLLVPIVGIVGTALLCAFGMVKWPTWILMGAMLIAGGFSITAGYHRLFAHRTYEATGILRFFFVFMSLAVFQGSVLEWASDHRNHHRYTDTDKDPYSVIKGFWHAHIGWVYTRDLSKRKLDNIDDLKKSRLLQFQHKYQTILSFLFGFGVPTAIAALWGDALSGFIVAGALRITLALHGTFSINSICHLFGKRTYADRISARDNWVTAIVTFGEGYHNYHHRFPLDYRNGVRFYQFDPSKWVIRSLSYLKLASQLRRTPNYRIIQARVETQMRGVTEKSQHSMIDQLQESMTRTIAKIKEFEKAYIESRIKAYRVKVRHANRELNILFQTWRRLLVV